MATVAPAQAARRLIVGRPALEPAIPSRQKKGIPVAGSVHVQSTDACVSQQRAAPSAAIGNLQFTFTLQDAGGTLFNGSDTSGRTVRHVTTM